MKYELFTAGPSKQLAGLGGNACPKENPPIIVRSKTYKNMKTS